MINFYFRLGQNPEDSTLGDCVFRRQLTKQPLSLNGLSVTLALLMVLAAPNALFAQSWQRVGTINNSTVTATSMCNWNAGGYLECPTGNPRVSSGAVSIGGAAPNASAILDLTSTTKGFLPPRMTTVQRDAISAPVAGLQVYNTTTNAINVYNGTAWGAVAGGGSIATATDVTLTSVADNDILRYDSVTSKWKNVNIGTAMSTTTMNANFPDAIKCVDGSNSVTLWQWNPFWSDGKTYYGNLSGSATLQFTTATGAYNTYTSLSATYDCIGKSISTLYAEGKAFNFIGSSLASAAAPAGGLQFNNGSGVLAGDSALIWDNTNKRLGIGTATPGNLLHLFKAGSDAKAIIESTGNNQYDQSIEFKDPGGSWFIGQDYSVTTLQFGIGRSATKGDFTINSSGSVGIGNTTPAATALLDITSTTKGFLAPRMTTVQRDAIASPATGLQIYNTTTNALNVYNGTAWGAVGSGGGAVSSLTDVTLTSVADNDILRYESATSKWKNVNLSTALGTTTMVANFPDAIKCTTAGGTSIMLFTRLMPTAAGGTYGYWDVANTAAIWYTAAGAYSTNSNLAGYDCVTNTWSVTQLYANGIAFNFIGSSLASAAAPAGGLQFNNGSGVLAGDTAIIWDNTNKRLGIGTATPTGALTISKVNSTLTGNTNSALVIENASGTQSMLGFSFGGTSKGQMRVDSSGNMILAPGLAATLYLAFPDYGTNPINFQNGAMVLDSTGALGIGTATPSTKAVLDLTSTTKGFLAPRMTTVQRDAIASPVAGLQVYNTTTNALNVYNGTAWGAVGSGGGGSLGAAAGFWVNFDGATGSISSSYNVSSVTRNGVGDYTVNFNTPMNSASYAAVYSVNNRGATSDMRRTGTTQTLSASSVRFTVGLTNTTGNEDCNPCSVIGFGDSTLGTATPAGSSGQVQWNSSGAMGGDSALTWDNSNKALGIGTATPSTKAVLDLTSTTKGFLPPRMSTAQRDAIATPATGLTIYNNSTGTLNVYNGTAWGAVGGGGGGSTSVYTSSWQTTVADASYTFAHGLGAMPDYVTLQAQDLTTGKTCIVSPQYAHGYSVYGGAASITIDSTNVIVKITYGSNVCIDTAGNYITTANSKLRVVASSASNPANLGTFAQGAAATPGLKVDVDTDTGLFQAAANTLSIATGGTERIRFDSAGNVGVGTTTPAATGLLDLTSTTKGFLPPRMTTVQRDAITSPATGLQIYNTTTNALNVYNGTAWGAVAGGGSIATATDVVLTSVANGNVLQYDSGTSKWVNVTPGALLSGTSGTTTMTSGWPDAIRCVGASGATNLVLGWSNAAGTTANYSLMGDYGGTVSTNSPYLTFASPTAAGVLTETASWAGWLTNCSSKTIAQLYATGQAFNFIGSSLASAAAPAGGLQFNNGSGVLAGDSAIVWDNTNKRLGIGTSAPAYALDNLKTDTSTSGTRDYIARNALTLAAASNSSAYKSAALNVIGTSGAVNYTGDILVNYSLAQHNGSGTLTAAYGTYSQALNSSTGTITTGYGAYNIAQAQSGLMTTAMGALNITVNNKTTGVGITSGYGAENMLQNASTGTITTGYGVVNLVQNVVGGSIGTAYGSINRVENLSTGTITTAYSAQVELLNNGGGTVTTWYGLYVPSATATTKYPIYVADTGTNYFAGSVGIGTDAPQAKLDVVGGGLHVRGVQYATSGSAVEIQRTSSSLGTIAMISDGATRAIGEMRMYGTPVGLWAGGAAALTAIANGNIGIGTTTPVTSALLEITSTTKGFLPPRMTTVQRDAIASPATGLTVYNTTTNALNLYNGSAWGAVGSGGSSQWTTGAANVIYYNTANVGIGTATPAAALDVVGDIQYTGVITDISDKRLKTNVNPLANGSLEKILKLRPVSFNMKSDLTALEFGFIAQEVEEVFPDLVKTANDNDKTKSLNYVGMIAPLVKSVQELSVMVQELKKENELLKARLNTIETKH